MRILFITATRIGDAVMSTGILRHLTEAHPEARLTIACGPLAESLFRAVPNLERVIVLDKKPFGAHWFSLWSQVRKTRWDLIVDLRRSLISYCVRTDKRVRLGRDDRKMHRVALFSNLLGVNPVLPPQIWTTQQHREAADKLVPSDAPLIAVAPIAARPDKTWPRDCFSSLIDQLKATHARLAHSNVVIVGGEQDRDELERLAEPFDPDKTFTLIGCSDLLTVYETLAKAAVIVANDSGMAHLAAATGRPTVALFGPTDPKLYRPWGAQTTVVRASNNILERAMASISVDDVTSAVTSLLN